ncbi:MAG: gliding motility-associated protein GldE [Bacteroidota bacterium]|nr:gliding motility-associated protein GldE [Bacteroidota bacterium]
MEDPEPGPLLLNILLQLALKPFTLELGISLLVVLILLLLSALISGSEVAYFSFDPVHLNEFRTNLSKKNAQILKLLEKPKRLLATILISNNFINVSIVILSTYITSELFYPDQHKWLAYVIQVIVVTALILLFGEIMPKILATQHSVRFASFMTGPLLFLIKMFYPLSSLLIRSTSFIDKRIARKGPNISMSELSEAIDITNTDKELREDARMLKGIVKFGDIEVKEIMKSRTDVTAVDIQMNFKDLLDLIVESGYSRIPAYDESFDKIAGILYIKDLLPYLDREKDFKWQDLLRTAFFVPENKKINDLLQEIQEKKIHMAIVVDEYGGTSGIVTLEDILEEIVGEISDEFDDEADEVAYSKIDEGNYVFEGKVSLNDFCKILEINPEVFDEVKGDSDSLAGLILELVGKIPSKNESIKFGNFTFTIISADKRRIKQIGIRINDTNQKD